jgi:hypothetical protein
MRARLREQQRSTQRAVFLPKQIPSVPFRANPTFHLQLTPFHYEVRVFPWPANPKNRHSDSNRMDACLRKHDSSARPVSQIALNQTFNLQLAHKPNFRAFRIFPWRISPSCNFIRHLNESPGGPAPTPNTPYQFPCFPCFPCPSVANPLPLATS